MRVRPALCRGAFGDPGMFELPGRNRFADQVALCLVAPAPAQEIQLGLGLYALGDHARAQGLAQSQDGVTNRLPLRIHADAFHERPIDLDRVHGELVQVEE